MTSVRRTASALLAVPLLALGACAGEEPEPEPEPIMPTKSASSSPSASEPSPTPQPWEAKTDDGAVAFVEHWIGLLNDARLEGEISPMLKASTQDCASCNNFAETIASWYEVDATYRSGPWQIKQVSIPRQVDGGTSVVIRVFRPQEKIRLAGDDRASRYPGSSQTYATKIRWEHGAWRMYEVVIVE